MSSTGGNKNKTIRWIANHKVSKPKPNLSPLKFRGRKWLSDKLKSEVLFVTKADKGGAILIMNYADVKNCNRERIIRNQ